MTIREKCLKYSWTTTGQLIFKRYNNILNFTKNTTTHIYRKQRRLAVFTVP